MRNLGVPKNERTLQPSRQTSRRQKPTVGEDEERGIDRRGARRRCFCSSDSASSLCRLALRVALRLRPLESCAHIGGAIADRLFLGSWRNRNAPLSCRRGSNYRYPYAARTRSDRPREKQCSARRRDEISPFCRLNDAALSFRRLLYGVSPAQSDQP